MTLYVYGNNYEGGGFLFYTLNRVMFVVLYFLVLVIGSYLSLHGDGAMAGLFATILLLVTGLVQGDIYRTFVVPSTTLSLAKACVSDNFKSGLTIREKKLNNYLAAKEELEQMAANDDEDSENDNENLMEMLLPPRPGMIMSRDQSSGSGKDSDAVEDTTSNETALRIQAIREMEQRYQQNDETEGSVSDFTESEASVHLKSDFFIYRQPSLNRATWEISPRPYRDNLSRLVEEQPTTNDAAEVWR